MNGTRIRVLYQPYELHEIMCEGVIEAPNLRTALLIMLDKVGMYDNLEDVLKEEKERHKKYSAKQLLKKFVKPVNGDGCDLIYLIKDDITGNVIFSEIDYGHWEVSLDTSM